MYDYKFNSCKAGSSGWSSYSYAGFADYDDSDAPFEEEDMEPAPKALLYLVDCPGSYVIGDDGELLEGDDFAMDRDGGLYWFDPELGYWGEQPGLTAYASTGVPLRFDEEVAVIDKVLTIDQTVMWYDYLGL